MLFLWLLRMEQFEFIPRRICLLGKKRKRYNGLCFFADSPILLGQLFYSLHLDRQGVN